MIRLVLLLALFTGLAFGNACVATGTGNFNSAGTWSACGGTTPGSGDTITVGAGITITMPTGLTTLAGVACNGTSTSPVTIQSLVGNIGWIVSANINCTYTTFLRMGNTSNDGLHMAPGAGVIDTFTHAHFDTCGQIWIDVGNTTSGWSITYSTWIRSNAGVNGAFSHNNVLEVIGATAAPSVARLIAQSVFDGPPLIYADFSSMIGNVFYGDYDSVFSSNQWTQFSGNLIRRVNAFSATNANGPMSGNYVILDHQAATYSGTAASATSATTSGTLTVSGTPWTTNAYQTSGSPPANGGDFMVLITGGTGAGQMRNIFSNTASTLTVVYPWGTIPDNTSTFSIFQGQGNPHWLTPASGVGNVTYSNNVVESFNTDNNGDVFEIGQLGLTSVIGNLILPSASVDNSGTLHTIFGFNNALTYQTLHNTYFTGAQSAAVAEGGNMVANQVTAFQSNLAWADPARTSIYLLTGSGGFGASALGPYAVDDSSHAGSCTGTTDIITAGNADYNGRYGLKASPCGANSYDLGVTTTPGTHDVTSNPSFVDSTRNFATWAASLGSTGSVYAKQVDGLNQLLLMNDSGYNQAYNIAALIGWVKAGFAPTNAAYHNVAADGADIGAIPTTTLNSHPRVWLTSTLLTTLVAKMNSGDSDWLTLKANADSYKTDVVAAYARSGCAGTNICYDYEGGDNPAGWYDAMLTLALVYQVTGDATYAQKAAQILDAANAPWKNSSDLTPITLDTGYPTRTMLVMLAIGYDWLYNFLSSQEKADTIATINAAYTWFSTGASPIPYCTAGDTCQGNPYMNYEGGHMLGFGLSADATEGDNSNATTIYNFIEALYIAVQNLGQQALPVTVTSYQGGNFNMTTGGFLGGAVPESYNYGTSGNERMWKLLLAWSTSGRNSSLLTTYTAWMKQSVDNEIYMLRPNLWQAGDEGDFPGNCSGIMHQDYPLFLAYILNGATEGAWSQYLFNNMATNPCSTNPADGIVPSTFDSVLWKNSARTATNYTSTAALNYASSGDGHLFARSDWTTGAAYFSFNGSGGNFTDHMHSSAGNLEVVHGSDYLLVGAGAWQSTAGYGGTPSIEDRAAQYQSTLYFNDGGAYMYTGDPYTGGQALWGNTNVLASRADAHVSYMLGDLDTAYDIIPANRVPANRTAQYYYREVAYLGGGAIFVQDRFLSKSSAYTMRLQWHLNPVTGAPTVSSNVISTVAGSSKLYIDTLLPSAYTITTARDVATSDGSTNLTYNMQVSNSSASTLLNGLTVIYATSSGGSLPTTTQLSTIDANHVGAQIQDTTPAVVVFAAPVSSLGSNTYAPTSYTSATFTTTHTGTANYLVAGMTPGTYSVTGPCASLCSSQVVGSDGTLYFTGTSGAYSIGSGGGSPSGSSVIGSGFLGAGVLQ